MKINIILKDEQKEFLDQLMNDYSLKNMETSIQSLVSKILNNTTMRMFLGKYAVSVDVSPLTKPFQLNWKMNR